MEKVVLKVEHYISYALILVGLTYAVYQTVELIVLFGFKLWESISTRSFVAETPGRPVAGIFFSVLLTLELISTIRVFAHDHLTKIRVILLVGMIAVTRKILEIEHIEPASGATVAALILGLSISYFLVSRTKNGGSDGKNVQH